RLVGLREEVGLAHEDLDGALHPDAPRAHERRDEAQDVLVADVLLVPLRPYGTERAREEVLRLERLPVEARRLVPRRAVGVEEPEAEERGGLAEQVGELVSVLELMVADVVLHRFPDDAGHGLSLADQLRAIAVDGAALVEIAVQGHEKDE